MVDDGELVDETFGEEGVSELLVVDLSRLASRAVGEDELVENESTGKAGGDRTGTSSAPAYRKKDREGKGKKRGEKRSRTDPMA
jgi:hypothetical protein